MILFRQFLCYTCEEPVGDSDGIVIWKQYQKEDTSLPERPIVVHKRFAKDGCEKGHYDYSYELDDFLQDFPKVELNI